MPDADALQECLRRINEAEACFLQMAKAQEALVAARQALAAAGLAAAGDVPVRNGVQSDVQNGSALEPVKAAVPEVLPPAGESDKVVVATNLDLSLRSSPRPSLVKAKSFVRDLNREREELEEVKESAAVRLGLEPDEIMKCFDYFCKADVDKSGKITIEEMRTLMESLSHIGLTKNDWDNIMTLVDKNDDGALDFGEFLVCYCNTPMKRPAHLKAQLGNIGESTDPEFAAKITGVPVTGIMAYLKKEIREEKAFLRIPIIFLLFICFVLSMATHRDPHRLAAIEDAFRFDIEENANFAFSGNAPFENGRMGHKSMYDVNSFADFWSWMDLGLTPLFFPESWDVSESRANYAARCTSPQGALEGSGWRFKANFSSDVGGASLSNDIGKLCSSYSSIGGLDDPTPPKDFFSKPPYLFFNSIIGGLRLRQEQLDIVPCASPGLAGTAYDNSCVASTKDYWLKPDLDTILWTDEDLVNKAGGETYYILSQTAQSDVRRQLRDLENRAWVNQRTAKVELLFTTYNAHQNIFVATYVNFFINQAGHIHKAIKPVGIWMDPYQSPMSYVFDVCWALLVLNVLRAVILQLRTDCRLYGAAGGVKAFLRQSDNIVDIACLIFSAVIFGLWFKMLSQISELNEILASADLNQQGSWASDDNRGAFFALVDNIVSTSFSFEQAVAFYPFAIGMRFFSAFSGQPRLAVVTRTLSGAASDLLHFGVVLFSILLVYSVSADLMYGREVAEFESFDRSLISVFRALLGDFDYLAFTEIGRPAAAVWFCSFVILLNLVMLNMLLAIVMDQYNTVKESLPEDAETILSQSSEIFRRWRQKKQGLRLSLGYVLEVLETTLGGAPCGELATVSTLVEMVPGLERPQALRILKNSHSILKSDDSVDINSMMKTLKALDIRVQELQEASHHGSGGNPHAHHHFRLLNSIQDKLDKAIERENCFI
eukprot:TRINITY_DN3314_c0_g1_i1.p1 TRINITY_DN3314_c0_g1~~TRINITY_DN3314_c0_g1_i1.p1  ORF type:complete len:944 (+),score=180.84 TRINITY_DN3314_c0_g1_i1:109-2940(+)